MFLRFILWLSRVSTPRKCEDIIKYRYENEDWWEPINPVDTGLGFHIDKETIPVSFINLLLGRIEIFDEKADISPEETHYEFTELLPDESSDIVSLEDFLWNGTGSYFLSLVDGMYVADFSNYEQYDVREGYKKYGGKVFMKDGRIVKFEYLGQTYHRTHSNVEKVIRATLCLKMMVEMHALKIHLCAAQRKVFEFRRSYSQDHPLIDFLYLVTYGILNVNRKISILISPQGLVPRLFALTSESYQQLLTETLSFEFKRRDILGEEGTAWNKEITKYLNYVEAFIGSLTDNEQIKEELTDFFVISTALHNQFGDAQIYSMTVSGFFFPKVYSYSPGKISPLDRDLLETLLVAVSTRYPLITDESIKELFTDAQQYDSWSIFISQVKQMSGWFDPSFFEISVGF